MTRAPSRRWLVAFLGAAALLGSRPRPSRAADFVVDRTDDDPAATACTAAPNDCSLRGAILAANALGESATPEASDVTVPAGTYGLSQASTCTFHAPGCNTVGCTSTTSQVPLCIHANVTLHGAGAASTTIDANGLDSVLLVSADTTVEVRGLTLTHGHVTQARFQITGANGGGVMSFGGLTLTDAAVTACSADVIAGGIYNGGDLKLVRSAVRTCDAQSGGGIFGEFGSSLHLVDSTIAGNSAYEGGGLFIHGAAAAITGSTISDNHATSGPFGQRGGGIFAFGLEEPPHPVTLTITNSTISGNTSTQTGGAMQLNNAVTARLANVTVTGNDAPSGGGIQSEAPTTAVFLRNTILAGNTGTTTTLNDCRTDGGFSGPPLTSEGYNIVGQVNAHCVLQGDLTGNHTGVDPGVGPLADNGGPTFTHALLGGSPAIDAGNPAGCTDPDGTPLVKDQRGGTRPLDGDGDTVARCDVGAVEVGAGLTITRVQPSEGGAGGAVLVVVRGSGFQPGAVVKLVRSGAPDIVGTGTTIGPGGGGAITSFDLAGVALGAWDVVVTNPDDTSAVSAGAFTAATARPPDLWVDVAGPSVVRVGRVSKTLVGIARYVLLYGNRGNVDAYAVPLLFGAGDVAAVQPRFAITPPPPQPGKITIQDFGRYYQSILIGDAAPLQQFPLLVPIVPAGFSGALEVEVTIPGGVDGAVPLTLEHADPLVADGVDPAAVDRLVAGAHDKAARLFAYTIPAATDPALHDYVETALATIVADGRASLAASFGTAPAVYSLSQLGYDFAAFAMVWSANHPPPSLAALGLRHDGLALASRLAHGLAAFGLSTADAQLSCACGVIPKNVSAVCCAGCQCTSDALKDPDPPENCKLDDVKKGKCPIPKTPGECRDIGFEPIFGQDKSGEQTVICTNNRKCAFPNSFAPSLCIRFPIRLVKSIDPNDKSGPLGAGAARFITTAVPLRYTVEFENTPTATAPAAEVTITDRLDPALVDLATLSLGPIAFGNRQVVPPPGLASFHQDVDLRPDAPYLVRIVAELDPGTVLLTWRLTTLDPATLQPPTDPFAGFLPPDVTPPEGSGQVLFTVAAKPNLATGTVIANQAQIVFDVNDPITTPIWSNTVDVTPPTSAVTSITPATACAQDLTVAWAGTDADSGVGSFDVAVAENDGPFVPWISTPAASAAFHGKWGKHYAFRTVATDQAGNVESTPSAPSQAVTVDDCGPHDLAIVKIAAPKTVKLSKHRPALTVPLKIVIQNRGPHSETIVDLAALAATVQVSVDALAAACPAAAVSLHIGKPQKTLPLVLASKKTLTVVADARFDCAVDKAKGAGHEDFTVSARVDQAAALGGDDAHTLDDVCPRTVIPPVQDPFPNGKIAEKGCGTKQDGGLGGPILVDVIVN